MEVLLTAIALLLLAGTAALLFLNKPLTATALGARGAVFGCLVGLIPTLRVLLTGKSESLFLPWDAIHGAFHVEIDPLSAFFLVPILGLSAITAVYGSRYLLAYRHDKMLGVPWFFFNVLIAGMALVVVARTVVVFLMAWEIMSLAAWFLVTFEQAKQQVRQAGWIYLIASRFGVLFLFMALLLLANHAGSQEFAAFRQGPALTPGASGVIFVLALVGFGTKAGFVPFHVWSPETYSAAPSHVSALMSGAMSKIGIYGILRVVTFLGAPVPWWALTLAGSGLVTALVGVALTVVQRDLKKALAYSSIENIGLIALALGAGLWGIASGNTLVAMLAMTAGLLHIWNHGLMKGLMFLAAGSIEQRTGTKDIEKLGGLLKRMPWTGSAMMVGAVAMAGLPPLNGFVSEWLLYLGLLNAGLAANEGSALMALFAVGLLALIGAVAAVAFVRLTGIVLLGLPRTDAAQQARESSRWLVGPMLVLVVGCFVVALLPQVVIRFLSPVVSQLAATDVHTGTLEIASGDIDIIGNLNAVTLVASAALTALLIAWARRTGQPQGPTWGNGYVQPTPRMQYTGRSFGELVAGTLLPNFLRPRSQRQGPVGLFPSRSAFGTETPDPFSDKLYEPSFRIWINQLTRLRIIQQGQVNMYLLYIVLGVVAALAWVSLRTWWLGR